MLTELRLRNWKRFGDQTTAIPLAPLTLVLGANSTGKSSILQALLAMKQSWESGIDGFMKLRTQGPWAALGRFGNVMHRHRDADMMIGLSWDNNERRADFTWEADFRDQDRLPFLGDLKLVRLRGANGKGDLHLVPLEAQDDGRTRLQFNRESWLAGFRREARSVLKARRLLWEDPLPGHWVLYLDPIESTVSYGMEYITEGDQGRLESDLHKRLEDHYAFNSLVRTEVETSLLGARRKVDSIRYVGPTRISGLRLYPFDESGLDHSGPRGERFAEVLFRIPNPPPTVVRLDAVNAYLSEMGVHYRVGVREAVGPGAAIEVMMMDTRTGGVEVGIPDVGFGISQLLPILTEMAAMRGNPKRSDILLIEQPELHLNPRWQQSFARLLVEPLRPEVGGTDAQNQVILETHSTHLVDEVARLVHDRHLESDQVCVLRTKIDPVSGQVQFQRLPVHADMGRYICEDY